jgi:hypothetical protein
MAYIPEESAVMAANPFTSGASSKNEMGWAAARKEGAVTAGIERRLTERRKF